jgi:hypothetical protein
MSLKTRRLVGSPPRCEVIGEFLAPSTVLWHMERLPGAQVLAKKSWVLTDDFEAFFQYKGRLFVLETPLVDLWLSMIGEPADDSLFAEVETHLQRFNRWSQYLAPVAVLRYLFTPLNPPRHMLDQGGGNEL